jgi:Ca2+/Na+ antiporter
MSISTWRYITRAVYGHLTLARISNSPTVMSNTLAGMALAGVVWPIGKTGLVAGAMVLFYTAGMYLNDLLDYPVDCKERPERPLPAGIVSQRTTLLCVLIFFALGSLLLCLTSLLAFLSGLALIALIMGYDRWHKNNPISLPLMGACRSMVYVTAFLAVSARYIDELFISAILLVCYVIGLTAIARTERTAKGAHVLIIAMLFLPALYAMTRPSFLSLPMLVGFLLWVGYSVSLICRREHQVGKVVGRLIAGISLLDGLVLAIAGSLCGAVLALGAFALTLCLQRYVRGT